MVSGLIDIHTHVIPGVDDGVKNVADSNEMLERYQHAGFSTVVSTPHLSLTSNSKYQKELAEGFLETSDRASCAGITLIEGREIRLSPEILLVTSGLADSTLGGSNFVLVDFPSGGWPHYAGDSIFRLQTMGYTPILAHPERYGWGSNHRNTPRDLVDRGVLLQVTLGSFVGAFGSHPRRVAKELLEVGNVHFTATDAHSSGSRMKAAIKGIDWLRNEYGNDAVVQTLEANPSAVLDESTVLPFIPSRRRRSWIGLDIKRLLQRAG